ncbi:molybdopterin-dependent oxidoreductase [Agarivorans sp. TSD2052]|uniref:nitrate reductase n=1 Tax=Agarivorans sp. TSD2052 TaxID=2937286 RepID=UPI00200C9C2F|nr:nitrate reductase [Agarivorans sp. TSD2052]UPW17610.1 molybdopterin-dependent oxidoreductase [Agarivorans sp. TSD2052]
MSQQQSQQWIKTTCPYCGTGCGVEAKVASDGKVTVRGDAAHPANSGLLCSKGSALGETVIKEGRLQHAYIKGHKEPLNKALSFVAARLSHIIAEHGPESVAFYVSGQLLTEDYYVANKLIKGFIGSSNIDSNSRLCMSSAVAGHKRAFGEDVVPGSYDDLEHAELVTLVGSNLAWCHPIVYQRLKRAKVANPHLKVVVIDPRRTDSCDIADLHLPLNGGTDVALFNGLLAYLSEHGKLNTDYIKHSTEGLEAALQSAVEDAGDLPALAQTCGLEPEALIRFFQLFADNQRCVTVFSQGVNQSSQGVDKVNAIINNHLATGKIGRLGASAFSITGQPNAMGGREVGALSNLLAGHLDYVPEHLAALSQFWQTEQLSQKPGYKAVELFEKIGSGEIKAVWIMGTNPAVSLPESAKVREALLACPLVVVSDCIAETDTTRYADVLLPAAAWGERDGTVTNSERMISRQRAFVSAEGDTKPDWYLLSQVAKNMGFASAFDYQSSADIFSEHAALSGLLSDTGERLFNISGLSGKDQQGFDQLSPQRWPIALETNTDNKSLFSEGRFSTASGKAQLIAVTNQSLQPPSQAFPLVLNTGRVRDQWHTMTRTGLAPQLSSHTSEPLLEIHPQDAANQGLCDGEVVTVNSQVGELKVRLSISEGQKVGYLFMPIHWNTQYSSDGLVSNLVASSVDPISGQPESKYTPVKISAWEYASEAVLLTANALSTQQCQALPVDYWVKQGLGDGYLYRIADTSEPAMLASKLKAFLLSQAKLQSLDFADQVKQHYRSALVVEGELFSSFTAAAKGQLDSSSWLESLLQQPMSDNIRRGVLAGTSPAPDLGKIVCSCHQVRQQTISEVIAEHDCDSAEQVGRHCKAGTNCGSCVPEIKRMIKTVSIE